MLLSWLLEFVEIISFFVLDRTCASLHAPTTKPVFLMVGDIPASARIPAFKEGHAMKVCYIAKTVDVFSARPGDETLRKPRLDLRRSFPNLGRRKYLAARSAVQFDCN